MEFGEETGMRADCHQADGGPMGRSAYPHDFRTASESTGSWSYTIPAAESALLLIGINSRDFLT